MEQLVARRAHNPKVVGSSPAPATWEEKRKPQVERFEAFLRLAKIQYDYRIQKSNEFSFLRKIDEPMRIIPHLARSS